MKDDLPPVEITSKFDGQCLDEEILVGMSIQLGWDRPELRNELLEWKYNPLTATYLLLQLRRVSGRSYTRMADSLPLKEFIHSE